MFDLPLNTIFFSLLPCPLLFFSIALGPTVDNRSTFFFFFAPGFPSQSNFLPCPMLPSNSPPHSLLFKNQLPIPTTPLAFTFLSFFLTFSSCRENRRTNTSSWKNPLREYSRSHRLSSRMRGYPNQVPWDYLQFIPTRPVAAASLTLTPG